MYSSWTSSIITLIVVVFHKYASDSTTSQTAIP